MNDWNGGESGTKHEKILFGCYFFDNCVVLSVLFGIISIAILGCFSLGSFYVFSRRHDTLFKRCVGGTKYKGLNFPFLGFLRNFEKLTFEQSGSPRSLK